MGKLSVTATSGANLNGPGILMIADPKTGANLFLTEEKSLRNNFVNVVKYSIVFCIFVT